MHFYGLGWEEVLALEVTWFCKLHSRIPVVESRRLIAWLPALSYPHLTERGHRDVFRMLQRAANLPPSYTTNATPTASRQQDIESGWARLRSHGIHASQLQKDVN